MNNAIRVLRTRTDTLKVYLTETEKQRVAEELARAEGDLREVASKAKDVAADFKAKKDAIDGTLRVLGQTARNGFEYRPVRVRIEADYRNAIVRDVREDTGEIVAERPLADEDRQEPLLPIVPAGPPPAAAPTNGKVVNLPALEWHPEGENLVARVPAGTYCIEPTPNGKGLNLWWTLGGKKSKRLETTDTISAAKDFARGHLVEQSGDAILADAGDGKLVDKKLSGPAATRKARRAS